jgi:hypothetical protein
LLKFYNGIKLVFNLKLLVFVASKCVQLILIYKLVGKESAKFLDDSDCMIDGNVVVRDLCINLALCFCDGFDCPSKFLENPF